MSADITELIEHLSRHEGGALGCAEVILVTPSEDLRLGASVDRVIAKLRGLVATREAGDTRSVGITRGGQLIELRRVLGFDPMTGCVAIEAAEPRDTAARTAKPDTEETAPCAQAETAIQAAAHADREAGIGHLIQVAIDAAIKETLTDLWDRLDSADMALTNLERSTVGGAFERKVRLAGKIEGVRLALSYIQDALRMAQPAEETQP